mgnify:CR=1 FL=1
METNDQLLLAALEKDMGLVTTPIHSFAEIRTTLIGHINHLVNTDFEKLVFYLYRIDVDEEKMRYLLAQKQDQNAAELIADLIIERQLQKIEYRKGREGGDKVEGEERW